MTEPVEFRYRVRLATLHGGRALILETEIPDSAPVDLGPEVT